MTWSARDMSGLDTGSKRRRLTKKTRQANLRLHLFRFYRADLRYHRIIEVELRPLWRAVEVDVRAKLPTHRAFSIPLPATVPSFDRLVAAVEGRPDPYFDDVNRDLRRIKARPFFQEIHLTSPLREQVAAYVDAVHSHLSSPLSLMLDGQPPAWAADFVHYDVTHEDALARFEPVVAPNVQAFERNFIHQTVTPTAVFLQLIEDGEYLIDPQVSDDKYAFAASWPGPGLSADDWETLESKAHEVLSHGLKALRERYQARSEDHNPTKLRDEGTAVKKLHDYLFPRYEGKRPRYPRDIQERLRKLARVIEVDFPLPPSRR